MCKLLRLNNFEDNLHKIIIFVVNILITIKILVTTLLVAFSNPGFLYPQNLQITDLSCSIF